LDIVGFLRYNTVEKFWPSISAVYFIRCLSGENNFKTTLNLWTISIPCPFSCNGMGNSLSIDEICQEIGWKKTGFSEIIIVRKSPHVFLHRTARRIFVALRKIVEVPKTGVKNP